MNWKILNQPLGVNSLGGGYAPRKKEIIPAIVMAAAAAGSAIYGGIKSSQENAKSQAEMESQRAREGNALNRQRYERWQDTAYGQNMLRKAREVLQEQSKRESGRAAITGATDAGAAIAKQEGNKIIGDVIADSAVRDEARRDKVEEQQMQSDRYYSQIASQLHAQRAANISQVAGAVSSALAQGAMASLGSGGSGTKSLTKQGGNGGTAIKSQAPAVPGTINQPSARRYWWDFGGA